MKNKIIKARKKKIPSKKPPPKKPAPKKSSNKEDSMLFRVLKKLITKEAPPKKPIKNYNLLKSDRQYKAPLIKLTTPKDSKIDDLNLTEQEKDDIETYVQLIKSEKRNVDNSPKEEFAKNLNEYEGELKNISRHLKNEYNPHKYTKLTNYLAKKGGINLRGDELFY